jgi:hypothetical protein
MFGDGGQRMSRWAKRGAIAASALAALMALGFAYYRFHYPYGYSHCCDKALACALEEYAEKHGGWFPRGEATPEASLSLLYRDDPAVVYNLRGKSVPESVVWARLKSGDLLTPETCGWHYVEGLRQDDDPELALFWDKAGLDHFGGRLSDGGHFVCFVRGMGSIKYIPEQQWEQFLAEQERLRTGLKRPR